MSGRTLSPASARELARVRAGVRVRKNDYLAPVVRDTEMIRSLMRDLVNCKISVEEYVTLYEQHIGDHDWMPDLSEPEDAGLQATPEVAVFRGVQTSLANAKRQLEPGNPFRAVCLGVERQPVEDNRTATVIREKSDDEAFRYSHRDESDTSILLRWNQPDDVADELDDIDARDDRNVWVERMTYFRQRQLHRLLSEYFGTPKYADRDIVLKWTKNAEGRWTPAEKRNVIEWINATVEERGSKLSGFSSCAGTIRSKMTRRRVSRDGSAKWWETYNAVGSTK